MTHQGQSFYFQTLSAIYYLIEEDLSAFALEGPDFEDSAFKRENAITTIGEAKYLKSMEKWTSNALFFHNGKGPLIQLWERDRGHKSLILFSYSDLSKKIKNFDKINIPTEELEEILEKLIEKPKIKRKEDLSLENLSEFIEKIRFIKATINKLEELITESLRAQDIESNRKKLRNFAGFINSDDYIPGNFITRYNLFRRLREHKSSNKAEEKPLLKRTFKEYYNSVIKIFDIMEADMKSEDEYSTAFMFVKKNNIDDITWNLHYVEGNRLRQRLEDLIGMKMESDYVIRKWEKKSGIFFRINKLKTLKSHSEVKEFLISYIRLIAQDNGISIT